MSLATRCPACTTTFKVVRDQLRISDGWVRCGRCSQVFDATQDLHDTDTGEAVSAPAFFAAAPTPVADVQEAPATPERPIEEPSAPEAPWPAADLLNLAPPSPAPEPESEGTAPPVPAWRQVLASARATPAPGLAADEPWPMRQPSAPAESPAPAPRQPPPVEQAVGAPLQKALRQARVQALREARARRRAEAEAAASEAPAAEAPESDALAGVLRRAASVETGEAAAPVSLRARDVQDAGLLAPAPSQAWPRRGRQGVLVLAALLALAALVFQVSRHHRDAWAAAQPALRPALAAMCQLSGCALSAPRRIDAVRIDGSAFTPDRGGDHYLLAFTLRNTAPVAVAMPSIELSLLDVNERAVVRRVFHPADFGAPAQMAPRGEQAAGLTLAVQPPEGQAPPGVVGYSMLAFYP